MDSGEIARSEGLDSKPISPINVLPPSLQGGGGE